MCILVLLVLLKKKLKHPLSVSLFLLCECAKSTKNINVDDVTVEITNNNDTKVITIISHNGCFVMH